MCSRTQESASNHASEIVPFKMILRLMTEVNCLLHIALYTSDSTIAIGTNTPSINNADTYYDHKTISISHLKLWKPMSDAAISHMYSLLLNFNFFFQELLNKQMYNTMAYLPFTPFPCKPQHFCCWCSALRALVLPAY